MLVLGIETSCDETALALVREGKEVVGTQVASSVKAHQPYGGVVPEIASRSHVELLTLELETLLSSAGIQPAAIGRIAVTVGPGLSGSLLMGISAAKALGLAWGRPVVGVHHLKAHLYAALMGDRPWGLEEPMVGLVISGGHTAIVHGNGVHRIRLMGQTRDDAVGEAFDKVAKLLGLGFPGGPPIEQAAAKGNPRAFRFSVPKIRGGTPYDFSMSGIKTAVLYKIQEFRRSHRIAEESPLPAEFVADLSASFQHSVIEEVVAKSVAACRATRVERLVVGGGVIANRALRERLAEVCGWMKIALAVPPMPLCTDNGAMVAGLGFHLKPMGATELQAIPNLGIETGQPGATGDTIKVLCPRNN